jgi:hypothetical protein
MTISSNNSSVVRTVRIVEIDNVPEALMSAQRWACRTPGVHEVMSWPEHEPARFLVIFYDGTNKRAVTEMALKYGAE